MIDRILSSGGISGEVQTLGVRKKVSLFGGIHFSSCFAEPGTFNHIY